MWWCETLTMLLYGILNFSEFSGILTECLNFKVGHRLFKCITEVNDQHLAPEKALHNPRGGQLICGAIDALQLLLITPQHNISAIETFKCVFVIILRCNFGDIKIGFWWAAGTSIV